MEKNKKEVRKFTRVGLRQLKSIVLNKEGNYESIEESTKATPTSIMISDISLGGACITIDQELKVEALIDIEIPKINELDATVLSCKVTRSVFKDYSDPMLYKKDSSDPYEDNRFYEVGLKFKNPNTKYLKQFIGLSKTNKI